MLFGLFASRALRTILVALQYVSHTGQNIKEIAHFFATLLALCTAMTTFRMKSSLRHVQTQAMDLCSQIAIYIAEDVCSH
jgi:hypothetical protein